MDETIGQSGSSDSGADLDTRLIVYGHDFCWQARRLASVLDKYGIRYEWRDVSEGEPRYQDELRRLTRGNLSVPTVVFLDGTVMVEPWPDDVLKKLSAPRPNRLKRLFRQTGAGGDGR
jgi:glutaredoxin